MAVKITLIFFLGMVLMTFAKNPKDILENIKSMGKSFERKTEDLISEEEEKDQVLGETIDLHEKIKILSEEIIEEVSRHIAENLSSEIKKEIEEKVQKEIQTRLEEITKQLVVEKIKELPEPMFEEVKEEICD